jgi:hypothetical protein
MATFYGVRDHGVITSGKSILCYLPRNLIFIEDLKIPDNLPHTRIILGHTVGFNLILPDKGKP